MIPCEATFRRFAKEKTKFVCVRKDFLGQKKDDEAMQDFNAPQEKTLATENPSRRGTDSDKTASGGGRWITIQEAVRNALPPELLCICERSNPAPRCMRGCYVCRVLGE